jgi:hypothetical protein
MPGGPAPEPFAAAAICLSRLSSSDKPPNRAVEVAVTPCEASFRRRGRALPFVEGHNEDISNSLTM